MVSRAEDSLMSTTEAANRLNVSRHTILTWVREGKLPALRLQGGHLRYRPEDVEGMLSPVTIEAGD